MPQTKFGLSKKLLDGVLVVGAGSGQPGHMNANFQAILIGSAGALHAKIDIETTEESDEVLDADAHWVWLASITLDVANWVSVADDTTDSFVHPHGLGRVRGNVKEISGTDASIKLLMGV